MSYQRQHLRELKRSRRQPWDIWHAKYLDLSVIQMMLCKMCSDWNNIGDYPQPIREQHPLVWVSAGQREVGGEVKSASFLSIWTQVMEEKLVEIWQQHLCLFDVSSEQYHNGSKKKKSRGEISNYLQKPGKQNKYILLTTRPHIVSMSLLMCVWLWET